MFRFAPLIAAQALADSGDGISLLQTAVHAHVSVSDDLPDPKKQSSMGQTEVGVWDDVDFNCKGGKGKWVWFQKQPKQGEWQDLSTQTTDIAQMDVIPDDRYEGGQVRSTSWPWTPNPDVPGAKIWGQQSFTQHGPVKDEKDCFNRAQIEQKCNHWMEDLKYAQLKPEFKDQDPSTWTSSDRFTKWGSAKYVFYKPAGGFVYMKQGGTCFCGNVGVYATDVVEIGGPPESTSGFWACRLEPSDFAGVDENTKIGEASGAKPPKEPKEKKTKEQRDACKAKKKAAKESRDALKDIKAQVKAARQALKDLLSQLRAAKADYQAKRGDKRDAC